MRSADFCQTRILHLGVSLTKRALYFIVLPMQRRCVILVAIILYSQLPQKVQAQMREDSSGIFLAEQSEWHEQETETSETAAYKRNVLVAAGALFFPNIVIGAWNRYVTQSGWAQVSFDYALHFYEHEWEWDSDWYWTNFVLHPYQGSLTYMGARSGNFTPYEAILWAGASSVIWEYFYETNAPSLNDLIYTTVGSFPVGEMLFRLSYELGRLWAPARFVANPVRIYSDPIMKNNTREPKGNVTELSFTAQFSTAFGWTFVQDNAYPALKEFYPVQVGASVALVYGNPYGHDSSVPYSQFELTIGGAIGPGNGIGYKRGEQVVSYDVHIISNGMLVSRSADFGAYNDTTIGLLLDYDFLWNSFFDITSLAPGLGIKQKVFFQSTTLEWQAHLGVILLGTADFYYYRRDFFEDALKNRSYSYTVGGQTVAHARFTHPRYTIGSDLRFYAMYDFASQITGDQSTGWECAALWNLYYERPIKEDLLVGFSGTLYEKSALYKDIENLFAIMLQATIYARFKIMR